MSNLESENYDLLIALRGSNEYIKHIGEMIKNNSPKESLLYNIIELVKSNNETLKKYDDQYKQNIEDKYIENLESDVSDSKPFFD